jgi:hypothetical protein
MADKFIVNISWNAGHNKSSCRVGDDLHAKWLWEAVQLYDQVLGGRIVVSMAGFSGIFHHRAGPERDYLWKVFDRCVVLSDIYDGHSNQAAGVNILLGLEFCHKIGIPYMIHTAEDVVPDRKTLPAILARLEEGYSYSGAYWFENHDGLNTQFFGCRASDLAPYYDYGKQRDFGFIEHYLKWLLRDKTVNIRSSEEGYCHTHDYDVWKRVLLEIHQHLKLT